MKKLLFLTVALGLLAVSACSYHAKQPVNPEYYKQTKGIAWPEEKQNTIRSAGNGSEYSNGGYNNGGHMESGMAVPSADAPDDPANWQDARKPDPKMAVPVVPEKKVQCLKKGDSYTCRYGQQICGRGCQSDGSNCSYGYCQKSACDDVMGQKWNFVRAYDYASYVGDARDVYACKHPNYNIMCWPNGSDGIRCTSDGVTCGYDCNRNGTDCNEYHNDCWNKYR